jgi:S1-C subfamily serine protease
MDNSGIEISDIILQVGDVKLTQLYVLSAKLNSLVDFQVGDEVEIIFYDRSENKIKTTTVILKK